MYKERATDAEWDVYYERAAKIRSLRGDPFRRLVRRKTFQERIVFAAAAIFMLVAVVAFGFLTMR